MQCPKCKHIQSSNIECETCGVIFERYYKAQERKKEGENLSSREKGGGIVGKLLSLVLLVVVVAGITYYFTVSRLSGPDVAAQNNEEAVYVASGSQPPVNMKQQEVRSAQEKRPVSVTSVQKTMNRGGGLVLARQATVSIETPWGTGSGFFVNENFIVTNRHVVEFDESQLVDFQIKMEKFRQMIELERQKIDEMKRKWRSMSKGPSRSQLEILIDHYQEELEKVLPQYEAGERKLEELDSDVQPDDIKIILADGSEHSANYLLVSENHDLALMSLYGQDRKYLSPPPDSVRLRQGDKVYTVGSPVGLRQTVTSGIFSGYRKDTREGKLYLQTDAAINPGNSGGPLIDEQGYVLGVTTMILQDTEGIGFAIPIKIVFEEFSGTLY